MASRKLAVTSVPSLLLIGAFLLVMASPGAVSEEGAASDQLSSTVRAPEPPSPKNYDTVRAGSPAVSSLIGDLTSAPEGSAAIPPQAPAPQPHPPRESTALRSSFRCNHMDTTHPAAVGSYIPDTSPGNYVYSEGI